MNLILKWWRKRQRSIDLQILWPACKRQAPDIETARLIFGLHAFNDHAWIDEYGTNGVAAILNTLQ